MGQFIVVFVVVGKRESCKGIILEGILSWGILLWSCTSHEIPESSLEFCIHVLVLLIMYTNHVLFHSSLVNYAAAVQKVMV